MYYGLLKVVSEFGILKPLIAWTPVKSAMKLTIMYEASATINPRTANPIVARLSSIPFALLPATISLNAPKIIITKPAIPTKVIATERMLATKHYTPAIVATSRSAPPTQTLFLWFQTWVVWAWASGVAKKNGAHKKKKSKKLKNSERKESLQMCIGDLLYRVSVTEPSFVDEGSRWEWQWVKEKLQRSQWHC